MKRVLLGTAVLLALWFGGRAIHRALQSDETRIRAMLTDAAAAFDRADLAGTLEPLAPDYRDATVGVTRREAAAGLLWLFQNRRDPTGRFRHRIELPPEDCDVQIDGDRATVTLLLRLFEGLDEAERLVWTVRITAGVERIEGSWRIVRSEQQTVAGQRPWR